MIDQSLDSKSISIVMCSTAHAHDDTRIFYREAITLSKEFKVTMIACGEFVEKKINENLRIIALPPWQKKSDRIRNLFLLFRKVQTLKSEIFIFHDIIGIILIPFLKMSRKTNVIFDIHENFYGWIREKDWLPKFSRIIIAFTYKLLEKLILRFTDMIWFAVPDIGEQYIKYKNLPKLYVPNFPPIRQFKSFMSDTPLFQNRFVFVGSMDADRSIIQIIQAFQLFDEKYPNYSLLLIGAFYSEEYKLKVYKLINDLELDSKVKLLGKMPFYEALSLVEKSKAGFSLHQPTYNFLRSMPLKLFEYIGMSVPVIASNFSNFLEIIERGKCGVCVDPNNITEISQAMEYLVSNEERRREMGQNGKKLIYNKYNWEKIEPDLFRAIHQVYSYEIR